MAVSTASEPLLRKKKRGWGKGVILSQRPAIFFQGLAGEHGGMNLGGLLAYRPDGRGNATPNVDKN